ncbi:mitogen-activated protein kinase kinase kinase 3-like [Mytilus trossulus]|uniref:mitogen-activated protein kinase kinase kinase 3-like n=1 Tax=Mytilus trossulus TaxID=6551 RepID=UPI003006821F
MQLQNPFIYVPLCQPQQLPPVPINPFLQPMFNFQVPLFRRINATDELSPYGYIFVRLLGQGSFGKVYLAKHLSSQGFCAVKCASQTLWNPQSQVNVTALTNEYTILRQMWHNNIVSCLGIITYDSSTWYLFLEYMDMGSIKSIYKQSGPMAEICVSYITHEVLNGVLFLHAKLIAHRDIKADNILLNSAGMIKIADFGITKYIYPVHAEGVGLQTKMTGTRSHMAPEIMSADWQTLYDVRVDIWSLGCTIIEMLTATSPQSESYFSSIVCGNVGAIDTYKPANCSYECWLFIKSTLNPNHFFRRDAALSLCDPWITMMMAMNERAMMVQRAMMMNNPMMNNNAMMLMR